jgi:hypothetical protein
LDEWVIEKINAIVNPIFSGIMRKEKIKPLNVVLLSKLKRRARNNVITADVNNERCQ